MRQILFFLATAMAAAAASCAYAQDPLNLYYCRTSPSDCGYYPDPRPRIDQPLVETRERLAISPSSTGQSVDRMADFLETPDLSILHYRFLRSEGKSGSQCSAPQIPSPFAFGSSSSVSTVWVEANVSSCGPIAPFPGEQQIYGLWRFSDVFTFGAPVRRKAFDGSEYEASPMVQRRDGQPWLTLYWGYRLGLTESQFDWDASKVAAMPSFKDWPRFAPKTEEFVLTRLPSPIVEGTVTEYINMEGYPTAPGGIYFYASTDEDRGILDSGLPGKWVRTGKSFKHGGYVSVCRFYGSVSPGPNTHFYTASEQECNLIKSIEVKPRPTDKQQLNYEGKVFYANLPIPPKNSGEAASCPIASTPLYRAYNAAFGPNGKRNYDSNHRFSTSRTDIAEVVAKGWVDEGMVFCVPQ
jgi:Repeat of unknown function (DUF5648)